MGQASAGAMRSSRSLSACYGCVPQQPVPTPYLVAATIALGGMALVLVYWHLRKTQEKEEFLHRGPAANQQAEVFDATDPLHLFANRPAEGWQQIMALREQGFFPLSWCNEHGHTFALVCAALNLTTELQWLIDQQRTDETIDWVQQTRKKCETPLWLAARCGHANIVRMILASDVDRRSLEIPNESGATPLIAAVMSREMDTVRLLLGSGANANAAKLDRMNALMIASSMGHEGLAQLLLDPQHGVDVNSQDRFGLTALLHAAFRGQTTVVRMLLDAGADVQLADNDGMTCLHHACKEAPKPSWPCTLVSVDHPGTIRLLVARGALVNARDSGLATPLHVVACRIADDSEQLAALLLELGADTTIESAAGWCPLHNACDSKIGNSKVKAVLLAHAQQHLPDFVGTFDPAKPRVFGVRLRASNSNSSTGEGEAALTAERLVADIVAGKYRKIVVLTGAGISTSAGIPAFRTPGGLYDRNATQQQTNGVPTFSPETFEADPDSFYRFVRATFLNRQPTAAHRFVARLHERGWLQRCYTQNIDGMHSEGLPAPLVVEAHGTLLACRCPVCRNTTAAEQDALQAHYRDVLYNSQARPTCPRCGSMVRPAVTFFGEAMDDAFVRCRPVDMQSCDLLIVMGTSLTVYPFAALVSDVANTVPRLLINYDAVGPWGATTVSPRDVFFQGYADAVITEHFPLFNSQQSEAASSSRI